MARSTGEHLRQAVHAICGGVGTIVTHKERAWSSITFSGTRHELVIRFEGLEHVEAGERLVEQLAEHEFAMPGQLVADAAVTLTDHRFGPVETLTVTAVLLLLEES